MTGTVSHMGTVVRVTAGHVFVKIHDGADKCGGCSVRFMCKTSGDDGDLIEVSVKKDAVFSSGDTVRLTISDNKQYSATLIALVLPCVALALGVVLAGMAGLDEGLCALSGLALTSLYFALLYMIRRRVAGKFTWNIDRLQV